MAHFKARFPSTHLESADLGGKMITVKIAAIGNFKPEKGGKIEGEGRGDDGKPKGLFTIESYPGIAKTTWVYPVTVARCMAAMFGDDDDGWIGKRVTIRAEKVEAFGEMVDAIRLVGSPDIAEPVTFSVPKGRGKVKMTMRVMKPRAPAAAPSPDEMARAEREAAQ